MTTDFAHTAYANRARQAKAATLAQLAYMHDWGFIVGADPLELRALRLEARVHSASEETWQLAHDLLVRALETGIPPIDNTTGSTT